MTTRKRSKDEIASLKMLRKIKNRAIKPGSLAPPQRRVLVSLLMNEGQSTAEIAQLLDVSDRTIERDRQAIRKEGSLQHDPDLVNEIAGQLQSQAELSIQRLLKIARDKEAPHAVKVEAYHRCFEISCKFTEKLQSLGFLPTAATKLEAKLSRGVDDIPSIDEIEQELKRVKHILPDDSTEILDLTEDIRKAKLASKVKKINVKVKSKGD